MNGHAAAKAYMPVRFLLLLTVVKLQISHCSYLINSAGVPHCILVSRATTSITGEMKLTTT
jgi:hypothetical protein